MAKNLLAMCLVLLVASNLVYEVQGTFLVRHFIRKMMFKRAIAFTPFACKGMLMLVNNLQGQSPHTAQFKEFFTTFKSFMGFINSASVSSNDVDGEMNSKADSLFKSMSALDGDSASSSDLKSTIMSMANTLIEQKRKGSHLMTNSERKDLQTSMVKWTQMVASFVKSASEKTGKSIDISSYGLDVDVNEKSIGGGSRNSRSSGSDDTSSTGSDSTSSTSRGSSTKAGSASSTKFGSESSTKSGSDFSNDNTSPTEKESSIGSSPRDSTSTQAGTGLSTENYSSTKTGSAFATKAGRESSTKTRTSSSNGNTSPVEIDESN